MTGLAKQVAQDLEAVHRQQNMAERHGELQKDLASRVPRRLGREGRGRWPL